MKYINSNKLETLKINRNNVYLVIDFDKTITTDQRNDSWDVSGMMLGDNFTKEINDLYEKYRPIELNYQITLKEKEKAMREWHEKCMELYFRYNLTKSKLVESVHKSNLCFRKGAKEILQKMAQEKIPVIILSAGIGNVIEQFLKEQKCYSNNIYIIANFIEFDENGKAKQFNNSKIIHTLNKTIKGKISNSFNQKIKNLQYKILIGDLKEDENMLPKEEWNTTLKIGFLEHETDNLLKTYLDTFDIVLTGEDATFNILDEIIF